MPRNPLARVFAKHNAEGAVAETELLTPTMKRITIVADEPMTPHTPGQHVRIEINDPLSLYGVLHPAETLRTYTIWDSSPPTRSFSLLAHLYDGDGIGLRWARTARPGDRVRFWGPQGDFATRRAPYHLFVGEETAAAAFGPMIRALAPGEQVVGVLESESAEDEVPVPGAHRIRRVHRHRAPAASSRLLVDALAALDLPDGVGAAYVAGEARTGQLVRDHLVRERGWPREAIKVKPFWTPGKRGLHH
ncbi:siderophore-interacting protein [Nonomuraea sp. NPDC050663]|uniref:siderophore-interacting protein n=1 Tax=Nonomuraea sp. NPDC050663 TaxID=3364370 RepID=UPI003794164B